MTKRYIIGILSFSTCMVLSANLSFAQTATSTAIPQAKHEFKINPNRSNSNPIKPFRPDPTFGLTKTIDQLSKLATKLETRISSESASGSDVTALTTLLTDMKSKIADAQTQTANNQITLTPTDTTATHSGFRKNVKLPRSWMSTARNDLRQAFQDAIKIIRGLKALHKNTTPTTTITPSTNETLTPTETETPTPTI